MSHRLAAVVAVVLLAGCATSAARRTADPGTVSTASAAAAGVEIVASAGAWRGWPSDLSRIVEPVHVSVVNRSQVPVRLSYEDFALLPAATGRRLGAVLPQDVHGVVYEPPPAALPSAGFALGAEGYPWQPDWVMRGPAQGAWSDPVARVAEQFPLPSPDMVNRALREGVLAPGDAASGFVYFERLPPHAGLVDLAAHLVDARSGATLGRVVIPLEF